MVSTLRIHNSTQLFFFMNKHQTAKSQLSSLCVDFKPKVVSAGTANKWFVIILVLYKQN